MSIQNDIAVVFEGVGSDTTKSGGIAFRLGQGTVTGSNYEYVDGLIDRPDSVETSVNPYTGDLQTSAFSFQIASSDFASVLLLHVQTKTPMALTVSPGASTTALTVGGTGNTALAGTVVFIDDECILVGTHAGAGVYSGNTRGYWGTTATGHGRASVYTKLNYSRYRRVTLLTRDRVSGTETVRWRGFIDDIATNDTGNVINVSCLEVWAAVSGAEVNKSSPRLTVTGHIVNAPDWQRPTFLGQTKAARRATKTDASSATIWHQLGDTLITSAYSTTTQRTTFDGPPAYWLGAPEFEFDPQDADSTRFGIPAVPYTETSYEVLHIDSRFSFSTADLAFPLHPVAISVALLISGSSSTTTGYDVFGQNWGLAIPTSLFDITAIDAVIAASPDVQIDRLLLGWDGESVNVLDVIRNKLLRPYGFFLTVTDDGLISVSRLEPVSIDIGTTSQASPVSPIPFRLSWSVAREGQYFQATASIGELPWRDADRIIVARDGSFRDPSRRSLFARNNETEYDFSTVGTLSDTSDVVQELMARVSQGRSAAPLVGVTVLDTTVTGAAYDLGGVISLDAPDIQQSWWIDNTGTRVQISATDASFIGIIIGRRYDISRRVYELTLLLLNWSGGQLIRWRAPSAVVVTNISGGGPSTVFTVTQNAFHASVDDTSFFAVNDEVSFFDPGGALVDGTAYIIDAITATTITISSNPTIAAGSIIRLSKFSAYSNTAHIAGVGRPFAYFAGSATLAANIDVYG